MCQGVAEQGQRCAEHTRPAFEAAEAGDGDWVAAASEYASTLEGREALRVELDVAALGADLERARRIRSALLRGERIRAEHAEDQRKRRRPSRTATSQEMAECAEQFGAAREQVLRDHAISHVLAALSAEQLTNELVFFGGTALSRTLLPGLRLSEDIDLMAVGDKREVGQQVETAVAKHLGRSHGEVRFDPPMPPLEGGATSLLHIPEGIAIKVQLLKAGDYPPWPTQTSTLIQRFSDVRPAQLTTFTPAAFVASKTAAWMDRAASRDLYDLWALGNLGLIDEDAAEIFRRCGGTAGLPQPWMWSNPPEERLWEVALAHQGVVRVSAREAAAEVEHWWSALS